MTKLTVDLRVNETLKIGTTSVRLEKKSGQVARLVVSAEPQMPITTPKAARMSALQDLMERNTHGKHTI